MLGIWLSGSNTRRAECAAEHEQASDIRGPAPAPAEEDARGAVVAAAAFRSINRVAPRCTTCGLFHHSPLAFGMLRAQLVQASVEGATIGRRRRLQRCCGGAADAQQGQDEQLEEESGPGGAARREQRVESQSTIDTPPPSLPSPLVIPLPPYEYASPFIGPGRHSQPRMAMAKAGRGKDITSHALQKEENSRFDRVECQRKAGEARDGVYKSVVANAGLLTTTASAVTQREATAAARRHTMNQDLVRVGTAFARIVAQSQIGARHGFEHALMAHEAKNECEPGRVGACFIHPARSPTDPAESPPGRPAFSCTPQQVAGALNPATPTLNDDKTTSPSFGEMQANTRRAELAITRRQVLSDAQAVDEKSRSVLQAAAKTRKRTVTRRRNQDAPKGETVTTASTGLALAKEVAESETASLMTDADGDVLPSHAKPRHQPATPAASDSKAAKVNHAPTSKNVRLRMWDMAGGIHEQRKLRPTSAAAELWSGPAKNPADILSPGNHWNFRFPNKHKLTSSSLIGAPEYQRVQRSTTTVPAQGHGADRLEEGKQAAPRMGVSTTWWPGSLFGMPPPRAADETQVLHRPEDFELSISVGRNGTEAEKPESKSGIDSVGRMVWAGVDGEKVSPRKFHQKRSDITSRRQVRNGFGISKETRPSTASGTGPDPLQENRTKRGEKTFQEKRRLQKMQAEAITAAAIQPRITTPLMVLPPRHTALPMHRPTENNWAFQTIYIPKVMRAWGKGNVSKIIRQVDYVRERPTFGPHANSN